MKTHFIAMAGLRGYLPNYCEVFPSGQAALESLIDLHELETDWNRRAELTSDWFVDLDIHEHGNEYAEIVECNCPNPQEHSEHEINPDDFE